MLADAHIHLSDLLELDPDFPERLGGLEWIGCAASHRAAEFARTEDLRPRLAAAAGARRGASFVASFGIHPQNAVWDDADFLARLVAEGRLAAIGEAGFDFFGDRPERVRNPENESAQRAVFEYQLGIAERSGLPLLLHLRKAIDLAFAYSSRLKRLRCAILHSYPGTALEAEALLGRGVRAYFSFGAPILNGNKRAAAACAAIPEDRLLAETDAPWQPPRRKTSDAPPGSAVPRGGGPAFCRAEDLAAIVSGIAALRDMDAGRTEEILDLNFRSAYGLPAD